jgi:lipopolysaccharide assembly protein A
MQFLKTLFWVALAVALVLFSSANWHPVTVYLWGGLEMDIKLPVLLLAGFLIGFLPMFILHRARLWSLQRRLDIQERQAVIVQTPVATTPADTAPSVAEEDRIATDSKAWPAP